MTTTIIRQQLLGALAACATGIVLFATATPASALAPEPQCKSIQATLVGTDGPDTLTGTGGDDVIVGLGGADVIRGKGGNDVICGDADVPSGPDGRDLLLGGDGDDTVYGGEGRDRVHGGSGNDLLHGGAGKDLLSGVGGTDQLFGDGGNDQLSGGTGDDLLRGGTGANGCRGGPGADNGIGCDVGQDLSIALAQFKSVSLREYAPGSTDCVLHTTISNLGSEAAQAVKVEAFVKGQAYPFYSGELDLHGLTEIFAAGEEHYSHHLGFDQGFGYVWYYTAKLYSGGTLIATASDPGGVGIKCQHVDE
jgi:Ca2+-binding RTX toxin-like protein